MVKDVLDGSSMRRIVPETQAVLRGTTNSKPSPETRVTYSCVRAVDDMLLSVCLYAERRKRKRVGEKRCFHGLFRCGPCSIKLRRNYSCDVFPYPYTLYQLYKYSSSVNSEHSHCSSYKKLIGLPLLSMV